MITFGLTGGIACGKSSVSYTFEYHHIPMIDADQIARKVVEPGKLAWEHLQSTFGKEYFHPDETLNRAKLSALVFSDAQEMFKLNAIMGSAIEEESKRRIVQLQQDGHEIIGYDAALLLENGNADKFRPLIVVSCPLEMQLTRLMKRNSLSEERAMQIINSQMPTSEKVKHADYVIDTSGTIDQSIAQTEIIIAKLMGK